MKKTIISLFFVLVALTQAVAAETFESGYLKYQVDYSPTSMSFGTVIVMGLTDAGKNVSNLQLTIPAQVTYNSQVYDVTQIYATAFRQATNLYSVRASYGLKTIGMQAFDACTNLRYINLPSSLTKINRGVFRLCSSLTRIYFAAPTPTGLTLDELMFNNLDTSNIYVCVGYGDANGLPLWRKALSGFSFKSVSRNANACDVKTSSGLCLTITQAPTFSSTGKCMAVGYSPSSASSLYLNDYFYFGYGSNYRADVTQIADSAMQNNTMITSVDLSGAQSLTYIGAGAFQGSSITSAKVQYGTAAISAFSECPNLKTLTFVPRSDGSKYDIGYKVCDDNPELTTINIQAGSVKSIGDHTFDDCPKLSSVTLGEGIEKLSFCVFDRCTALTSLTIPASVTDISVGHFSAFYGCTNLSNISVNSNNPNYSSYAGALYNKAQTTLLCVPEGCTNLQGFPYTLTTIGDFAFNHCEKTTEQEIPYGVKTIGHYVFFDCTALTRLHIPSSVTSLGTNVCYNCTALSTVSVNMAAAPTITPSTFFSGKSQIARLYTPQGLEQEYRNKGWNIFTSVNEDIYCAYDFMKGSSGTNLCYTVTGNSASGKTVKTVPGYIPESATATERSKYIGNMTTAATLNIPPQVSYRGNTYNLNSIGFKTFSPEGAVDGTAAAPTGVLTVNLPGMVTTLEQHSFYKSRVKSLSMPGVVTIKANAFVESALESVQFPHTLKVVDDDAFWGCSALTGSAIFPYGFKEMGAYVFKNTQITKIVVPSSVTKLGYDAFTGMSEQASAYINLPASKVSNLPSTLAHIYVPYYEEIAYENKFEDIYYKFDIGGYDFAEKTRNGGYLHYSVIDSTAHTWKGTQFAGKVMIVDNPDDSAAPTTLSVTADAHDNALGGSNVYRVTRYDSHCLRRCPSLQMNDQGAWESIEEIGGFAFANSQMAYHIDWPDHRSDLFRVGPQVTDFGYMPFGECNMAGMFIEPASGQRSVTDPFKEASGNFVCYASYDDKDINNLAQKNPKILSIYYQKDGVTSDAIYSPVPIDYAATAAGCEGFSAYAVTGHNGDVAQAMQIESAPAGTAVMIRKNADNKPVYFTRLDQDPDWTGKTNLLWGSLTDAALQSNDYAYNTADEQWVNANNTTTAIGHAYLRRTDSATPATMTVNYGPVTALTGDVDGSGIVDIDDVNAIINIILEKNPASDYSGVADVDGSGLVDVDDVNEVINIILNS